MRVAVEVFSVRRVQTAVSVPETDGRRNADRPADGRAYPIQPAMSSACLI